MVVPLWMGIEGWGTKEEVSRSADRGRGLEVRGAAAGRDLGDCASAGGLEGAERVVDLTGGLVVLEGVADLAAGGRAWRAAWICSASGWPVAPWSAHAADRAA